MALIKVNKRLELRFWIVVFSVVFIGTSNGVYCQAPTLTTPAIRESDEDAKARNRRVVILEQMK